MKQWCSYSQQLVLPAASCRSAAAAAPYRGPVPIVTHLHGAEGIGDESDGYSEAWYLPGRCRNVQGGVAQVGAGGWGGVTAVCS
jgi:hypothetical protein